MPTDIYSSTNDGYQMSGLKTSWDDAHDGVGLSNPDINNTRDSLEQSSRKLFNMIEEKKIKINLSKKYSLKDACVAHLDLESRKTFGSVILKT